MKRIGFHPIDVYIFRPIVMGMKINHFTKFLELKQYQGHA
jgi:hypothetical protein